MLGHRLPDVVWPDVMPDGFDFENPPKGAYWKCHGGPHDGAFYICAPDGSVGCLEKHYVIEHEDGQITVQLTENGAANSIQISTTRGGQEVELWHGSIERGVWVHI